MAREELKKRLRLLFSEYLIMDDVKGKRVLDIGAGMGYFSRALTEWGAEVVAVDMGPTLMSQVREKCPALPVVGSVLELMFRDSSFDVVLCTEVIEHTTDPARAVSELCRVTAPGGLLVVTTPNRVWKPAIVVANTLHLRPYMGYENWVGYGELAGWIKAQNFAIERQEGFNLLPHTFFCRQSFDFLDKIGFLWPFMINIALKARKRPSN